MRGFTDENEERGFIAQVAAVNQGLLSVSKICATGHRVVFDEAGSYIEHKATGQRTKIEARRGVYNLRLWVPRKFF